MESGDTLATSGNVAVQLGAHSTADASKLRRSVVQLCIGGAGVAVLPDVGGRQSRVKAAVGSAKNVVHGVPVATQLEGTEAAGQADVGLTIKQLVVGRTIAQAQLLLELEDGRQTAAQIFRALEAQAAGVHTATASNSGLTLDLANPDVSDTVQGHAGLGHGSARSSQNGQSNQRLFHEMFPCLKNPVPYIETGCEAKSRFKY
ncbi:hypothetical protein D9M68_710570 [compost metagenome]